MTEGLRGKVALVTGGSHGPGEAVVKGLAVAGADVAVGYLRSGTKALAVADMARRQGVRAMILRADIGDPVQATRMVEGAAAEFGRIDILVNGAGNFVRGAMGKVPVNHVARLWAVNVHGLVVTTESAVEHMPDGGRVINLSFVVEPGADTADFAHYAATTTAVRTYVRSWARGLASRGITVNTIRSTFSDIGPGDRADGGTEKRVLGERPLHPHINGTHIASAVTFLASPAASLITGIDYDLMLRRPTSHPSSR